MNRVDSSSVKISCPAKINLYLAVIGRREDGFHELVSVAAPLVFGDSLEVRLVDDGSGDVLEVDGLAAPEGEDNLVLRAVAQVREKFELKGSHRILLRKHIPLGAGLGGGSSDAVGMIRALTQLHGLSWETGALEDFASTLGSDCPLFLNSGPVIFRGRGEQLEKCDLSLRDSLVGTSVFLFKPVLSVATAEAFRRLGALPSPFTEAGVADAEIKSRPLPYRNDFEPVLRRWMPGIPAVLESLRGLGLDARLSGSGSAGYILGRLTAEDQRRVRNVLENAWGAHYWSETTGIL